MVLKGFALLFSIGLFATLSACQPAQTTAPQEDAEQEEEVQPGGQVEQDDDEDEGEGDD